MTKQFKNLYFYVMQWYKDNTIPRYDLEELQQVMKLSYGGSSFLLGLPFMSSHRVTTLHTLTKLNHNDKH